MGNRLGWIIAGIFVVGVVAIAVLVVYQQFYRPTPPTSATTARGRLSVQKPSEPITLVVPAEPSGEGDAGDDYLRAVQAYRANPRIREICRRAGALMRNQYRPTPAELALLQPVADAIRAGAQKRTMTYTWREHKEFRVPYIAPEASELQAVTDVPVFLHHYHIAAGEASYPQAERCLFDEFILGWHMMNERARLGVVRRGFGLQKDACRRLMRLYAAKWNKPDRHAAVKRYLEDLTLVSGVYADLEDQVLWRIRKELGLSGPHPGDVFNLAENHADPAVRRHATVVLGVVKLTCRRSANKRYVRRLIASKLRSSDEIERAAARAAQAFGQEELNQLKRL